MSAESSTASGGGRFAQLRAARAAVVQARIQELQALAAMAAEGGSRAEVVSDVARVAALTDSQAGALLDLALSLDRGEIEGPAAAEACDRLMELCDDLDDLERGT